MREAAVRDWDPTAQAVYAFHARSGYGSIERLIGFADQALYAAKQAGRDCTVVYSGGD